MGDIFRAEERDPAAARMPEQKGRQRDARLAMLDDSSEVIELDGIRVVREKVEAIERVGPLADAAPRHIESAHRQPRVAQHLGQPWKKSPVFKPFEAVDDDHQRLRAARRLEIAANGESLLRLTRE